MTTRCSRSPTVDSDLPCFERQLSPAAFEPDPDAGARFSLTLPHAGKSVASVLVLVALRSVMAAAVFVPVTGDKVVVVAMRNQRRAMPIVVRPMTVATVVQTIASMLVSLSRHAAIAIFVGTESAMPAVSIPIPVAISASVAVTERFAMPIPVSVGTESVAAYLLAKSIGVGGLTIGCECQSDCQKWNRNQSKFT